MKQARMYNLSKLSEDNTIRGHRNNYNVNSQHVQSYKTHQDYAIKKQINKHELNKPECTILQNSV